jgi:predicted N-acetyltransferase YhbS
VDEPELIARVNAYRRTVAHGSAEPIARPPLTVFVHPAGAPPGASRAVPDGPIVGDVTGPLAEVLAVMRARGLLPCVEILDRLAPALPPALAAAGLLEVSRQTVMACRPEDWRPARAVPGLGVAVLDERATLAEVREGLAVNERGFDPTWAGEVSLEQAETFRQSLRIARAFTARLDDAAVGAGLVTPVAHGIAELVGVATLVPYRGRGVAAALTAEATRTALAAGAEALFLVADHAAAGRVYARVGFRPIAQLVGYESAAG